MLIKEPNSKPEAEHCNHCNCSKYIAILNLDYRCCFKCSTNQRHSSSNRLLHTLRQKPWLFLTLIKCVLNCVYIYIFTDCLLQNLINFFTAFSGSPRQTGEMNASSEEHQKGLFKNDNLGAPVANDNYNVQYR